MEQNITILQIITIIIAVLGAFLGIINTLHNLNKTRVKLKVLPAHAIPVGGFNSRVKISIEVTNFSSFPVTIASVGFLYKGSNEKTIIIKPIFLDEGSWPRRLESRSSVTVCGPLPEAREYKIKCSFAKTQCGVIVKGNSDALKQIANELYKKVIE